MQMQYVQIIQCLICQEHGMWYKKNHACLAASYLMFQMFDDFGIL